MKIFISGLVAVAILPAIAFASDQQDKEKSEIHIASKKDGSEDRKKSANGDYAWDNFNHTGALIWACREIRTGAFVSDKFCANQEKNDLQWPGMTTPPNFVGEIAD